VNPTFPLCEHREHTGHHLAGRRGHVDAEVERDDCPAALAAPFDQRGEVDQRT
jgi:hypothetical protein